MTPDPHAAALLRTAEAALRVLLVGYAWGMIAAVAVLIAGPLALVGLVFETVRRRA